MARRKRVSTHVRLPVELVRAVRRRAKLLGLSANAEMTALIEMALLAIESEDPRLKNFSTAKPLE